MSYGDQFKSNRPLWFDILFSPPVLFVLGLIAIGCMAVYDARQLNAKLEACKAEYKVECKIATDVALPVKQ